MTTDIHQDSGGRGGDSDKTVMPPHHPYSGDEVQMCGNADQGIYHRKGDAKFCNKISTPKSEAKFSKSCEEVQYIENTRYMQIYNNTDCRSYTERRNISHEINVKGYSCVLKSLYWICIFFYIFVCSCTAQTCDFKGSGLDLDGTGIQPVYLSCASGKVEWHYPRAALRILLQFPGGDREFHGCIKASPEIEGARLFVEGHRSLVPLYSRDDEKPKDRIRCFTSYKGRVALYLEAEPTSRFRELRASFEYDLQPLTKGEVYDPMEDCRPCSNAELVRLYCSADFAARGFIISTENDLLLQQTKVTLAASKVFQQTTPVFSSKDKPQRKNHDDKRDHEAHHYFLSTNALVDEKPEQRLMGQLFMPMECGARAGAGEFMVLGTVRLGQPVLRCAPRIEEWSKIVRSAQDLAHCVLET